MNNAANPLHHTCVEMNTSASVPPCVSAAEANQARAEMHLLPAGWFRLELTENPDIDGRRDYITLSRMAGPPLGFYAIARIATGYSVEWLPEPDQSGGGSDPVEVQTTREAMEVVRADIDRAMACWGVQLAA